MVTRTRSRIDVESRSQRFSRHRRGCVSVVGLASCGGRGPDSSPVRLSTCWSPRGPISGRVPPGMRFRVGGPGERCRGSPSASPAVCTGKNVSVVQEDGPPVRTRSGDHVRQGLGTRAEGIRQDGERSSILDVGVGNVIQRSKPPNPPHGRGLPRCGPEA